MDFPARFAVVPPSVVGHQAETYHRLASFRQIQLISSRKAEGEVGKNLVAPYVESEAVHEIFRNHVAVRTIIGETRRLLHEDARQGMMDRASPDADEGDLAAVKSHCNAPDQDAERQSPRTGTEVVKDPGARED